jgi:hypothetical protein
MLTLRSHTHWQAPQAYRQAKACQRVCLPNAEKKKLKISFPSKILKPPLTADTTMIVKLTHTEDRTPAPNKVLPQWGLTCFYETFVVKRTAVHLLNISAKNPPLRQYPKRCAQFPLFPKRKIIS